MNLKEPARHQPAKKPEKKKSTEDKAKIEVITKLSEYTEEAKASIISTQPFYKDEIEIEDNSAYDEIV